MEAIASGQHPLPVLVVQRELVGLVEITEPLPYGPSPERRLLDDVATSRQGVLVGTRVHSDSVVYESPAHNVSSKTTGDIYVWARLENGGDVAQGTRRIAVVRIQPCHNRSRRSPQPLVDSMSLSAIWRTHPRRQPRLVFTHDVE